MSYSDLGQAMKALAGGGVNTLSQASAMVALVTSVEGSLAMSELAEELGVVPAAVTGMADAMAKLGLVRRVRSEADRRTVLLMLTDAGEELIRQAWQQTGGVES